jgi:rSAM/selenodomain-associated transferase 1
MSPRTDVALAVIAKAPVPGRSKTRLSPPFSLRQAAMLAERALADTLAAVAATSAGRKAVILEGDTGSWLPAGIEVIAQRGAGLDERLANAFIDLGGPLLIIGMDTPQVTGEMLQAALSALDEAQAVLGPAADGGYWAIGLQAPDPRALLGVPMSTPYTYRAQCSRLRALGLTVAELQMLRDVDTFEDALAVSRNAPSTQFASALAEIQQQYVPAAA